MRLTLLHVLVVVIGISRAAADCDFHITQDVGFPPPILLKDDGALDVTGFVLPGNDGMVHLEEDQMIIVACPGGDNSLTGYFQGMTEVTATCVSGTWFNVEGRQLQLSSLTCMYFPQHDAVPSGRTCYGGNVDINIGFEVSRGFYTTINVCFDERELNTLYSNSTILSDIGAIQSGTRMDFLPGSFFGDVSPEFQYRFDTQLTTIENILGSERQAKKYIKKNGYFLAKGHLVANSDFVYLNQQRTSSYFVNVAPQWQTFNGGNWAVLEQNVQNLAKKRGYDLEVYTGTYGIAFLPNEDNENIPLYLTTDGRMPIPQFYWKVVYHRETNSGVACVGINNPYVKMVNYPELRLCPDVSGDLQWLTWNVNIVKRGEGYCCEVEELRNQVPYLPDIYVPHLLT